MTFVLDASTALAWHFDDEDSPYADRVLERLQTEGAFVPSIWALEVANGLLMAEKRGRMSIAETAEAVEDMLGLRITILEADAVLALRTILVLARGHGLTTYDAAYLDLAMREGLPLATQDRDLKRAAGRVGVELIW